ncbi:hypothetical protein QYZ87_06125 [Porphyromonadaceae bacterium W3.11]|nr:hypothetical protein [Porphyromonadaceae bacterium W3.11]
MDKIRFSPRLLFLLSVFLPLIGYSQMLKIEGTVLDKDQRPIPQVLVLVRDAQQKPIAYATSESNGQFVVSYPSERDATDISWRLLGWETLTTPIAEWKNGSVITLKETAIELNEVTVKASKIEQRGDTLSYQASAFRHKQDLKISDVLAKLPGVEVKTDGTIKFQGKSINKFYIEGMDLLGNRYNIASNNIDASKVKKIEVYKNHQPIQVLQNVSFSDQAALNIILSDDAKSVWQGVINLGIGSKVQKRAKFLRDSRAMVMFFAPKMQSISMVKTNNIGEDAKFDIRQLATAERSLPKEEGLLSEIRLRTSGVAYERYRFNDSYLGTSNWLFRTKGGNDLRIQLHGYMDKSMVNQSRQTKYLQVGHGETITEDIAAKNRTAEGNLEVKYEVNKSGGFFNTKLKGYADLIRSTGISYLNSQKIEPHITSRHQWIEHDMKLIQKTKNGHKWSVVSQMMYSHLPGDLLLVSGEWQQMGLNAFDWEAYASFGHRLWGLNMDYMIGVTNKSQQLSHTISNNAKEKQSYSAWTEFIEPSINYRKGLWSLTTKMRASLLQQQLAGNSGSHFLFDPYLRISYEPTPKITFSANLSQNNTPQDIKVASTIPFYLDYNTIMKGSGKLEHLTTRAISGNIKYENPVKSFFSNLTIAYYQNRNSIIYKANISDITYIQEATDLRDNSHGYNVSGRMSQAIGWSTLNLSLFGNYNHHNYHILIGNDLMPYTSNRGSLLLNAYYHPISDLSFDLSSSINHSSMGAKEQKERANIVSYEHNLKVFYMPGKWTIEWVNNFFHSPDKSISNNYLSDLSISYRDKKYEAKLECRNIFGTTEYVRRWLTPMRESSSVTNLRGREIIAKISFSF